jgi:hypothetical protein
MIPHSAVLYLFSAHRWMEYFEKLFCRDVNVPTTQQEDMQEAGQILRCSNCDRSPSLIRVAVQGKRSVAKNFIPSFMCIWLIGSRWYTSEHNVVTTDMQAFAPPWHQGLYPGIRASVSSV